METVVRPFSRGDEEVVLEILHDAFGNLQDTQQPRRVMASPSFEPKACFVATQNESPVGCVAITCLPRTNWYAIRYLAVKHSKPQALIAKSLLDRVLKKLERMRPEYVRSTTPSVEPYVGVYKSAGFRPVRRDFRITWTLAEPGGEQTASLRLRRVTDDTAGEAARLFVKTLTPIWDWRTAEQGGPDAIVDSFLRGVKEGEHWIIGHREDRAVGLAGLIPDFFGHGDARFRGAFVDPDCRREGIGSTLVLEATNLARELGQRKMTVYTFSYLDHLAPGALLYLGSGGKIDAEYLQLQKPDLT